MARKNLSSALHFLVVLILVGMPPHLSVGRMTLGIRVTVVECDKTLDPQHRPFPHCLADRNGRAKDDFLSLPVFLSVVNHARRGSEDLRQALAKVITANGEKLSTKVKAVRGLVLPERQSEFDRLVSNISGSTNSESVRNAIEALSLIDTRQSARIVLSAPQGHLDELSDLLNAPVGMRADPEMIQNYKPNTTTR